MTRRNPAYLAAAGLLAAFPAMAVEADQQAAAPDVAAAPSQLADVIVTANRTEQPLERVGASVTVLNQAAIEAAQSTALVELLERTPGVSFARNGGVGTTAGVFIRGGESYHTVLVVDGVKLNDPSSTQGGANFGGLLTGDIARIEVLRGAQSTLWGSQAIGGVVNVITAEPTESFEASLDAEAGSRGTTYLRGGIGGVTERLIWRLAGGYYETDGFSAYRYGTEKDGYENGSLSGRARVRLTDAVSLDLRAVYSDGRADFDGWGVDSREYGDSRELVAYAGLNIDLLGGRFRSRFGHAYTDIDRENYNPAEASPLTFESAGVNRRWEYQGTFAVTEALSAVFGLESESSRMRTRSPSAWTPNPAFTRGEAGLDSAYGQLQWTVVPGLTLTGGLRYDDHDAYGDHLLGQAAVAWTPNDGATVVRASWGQGFRAPGLYELYSEYGNLTLEPEEIDSWEIGVEQRLPGDRGAVSATVFAREGDNEIRYFSCAFGTTDPLCTVNGVSRWGYYANIQKTETKGVELAGRFALTDWFELDGNYTWTDATNASGADKGKQLVRRPEHMGNLAATVILPAGVRATLAARHVGETFANAANTVTLDSYTLADLRASWAVNDTVELYGRVENLFDQDYEVVPDYGVAGRGAFIGVRARF